MPIFEDFSQNGELLQVRFELLNKDNFARYIKVHGVERAQGYIKGLEDAMTEIENDLLGEAHKGYTSSHAIGRETRKFVAEKIQFINLAKQLSARPDIEKNFNLNLHIQSQNNNLPYANTLSLYYAEGQIEKVEGYLDCLEDITKNMEASFKTVAVGNSESNYTPFIRESSMPVIGNNTKHLHKDRSEFLALAKEALILPGYGNKLIKPSP